jgi:2-dehydro-3-deoxyphosphogluconate aldolase/(4S)-4-hydroxy-2-oxoglutarate aldolase
MAADRMSVLAAILEQGVVPVFNHPDPETCAGAIEACARGGAPCVELTNRGDLAFEAFRAIAPRFAAPGSGVVLGVGSVVDAPTTALYLAYGARFVVSPSLSAEIARICNRRKVAYMPGCGSLTEIGEAEELGVEIVKMFPGAAVGGPEFVKAALGPCPWTRIMPTGGVEPTAESLGRWFGAGVAAVGIGSRLIPADLLEKKDFAGIERNVRAAVALARQARGKS